MTRTRKRLVIGLVLLVAAAGVTSETYRFIDEGAVAREAEQAKNAAIAATSPATGPDDACRWLESNGYRVVAWNPHNPRGFIGLQESSVDGKYVIVEGQRQIRRGNWLIRPTWLDLTFRFTLNGVFHDVQAEPSQLDLLSTP